MKILKSALPQLLLLVPILLSPDRAAGEASPDSKINWEHLQDGLDMARTRSSQYLFFSTDLILIRIDLKLFVPGVVEAADLGQKATTIEELVQKTGGVAGINASFFDENQSPLGLVISRGKIRHKVQTGGSLLKGIFQSSSSGIDIVNRLSFYSKGVKDAFQGGPILIDNNSSSQINKTTYEKRSGVCIDTENKLIIFSSDSNLFGFSLQEIQEILRTLNCRDALNLDGGASTQLFVQGNNQISDVLIKGIDKVPVGLIIFRRTNNIRNS